MTEGLRSGHAVATEWSLCRCEVAQRLDIRCREIGEIGFLLPEEGDGFIVSLPLWAVHEGLDGVQQIVLSIQQGIFEVAEVIQEVGVVFRGESGEMFADRAELFKERIARDLIKKHADIPRFAYQRFARDLSDGAGICSIIWPVEEFVVETLECIYLSCVELLL